MTNRVQNYLTLLQHPSRIELCIEKKKGVGVINYERERKGVMNWLSEARPTINLLNPDQFTVQYTAFSMQIPRLIRSRIAREVGKLPAPQRLSIRTVINTGPRQAGR